MDLWKAMQSSPERDPAAQKILSEDSFKSAIQPNGVPNVSFLAQGPLSDFHDKILFNALEYVALFKAHRPTQTLEESILPSKKAQADYETLMRDVRQARIQMSNHFQITLQKVQKMYQTHRSQREVALASHHLESVNRCRRAQRTNLSNAIAILVHEADTNLTKELAQLQSDHTAKVQSYKKKTLAAKAEEQRKRDQIEKLKVEISKWQTTLRRNNVAMEFEKISEDVSQVSSAHYQLELTDRDEKIASLNAQLQKLEEQEKAKHSGSLSTGTLPNGQQSMGNNRKQTTNLINNVGLGLGKNVSGSQSRKGSSIRKTSALYDVEETSTSNVNLAISPSHLTLNATQSLSVSSPMSNASRRRSSVSMMKRPSFSMRQASDDDSTLDFNRQTLGDRMSEIISRYEPIIEEMKEIHRLAVESEIAEKERIQSVYKERFQEDLQDTAKKLSQVNFIAQSRQTFSHIETLFPFKLKRGMRSAEVQCDLDGLGAIVNIKTPASR